MPLRPAHSKTHRFVEVLALISLTSALFTRTPPLSWFAFDPTLAFSGFAAMLLAIALVYSPFRKPAWVAILAAGLYLIAFRSESADGILHTLFGSFLVFDSGWPARRTLGTASGLAALVVVAQVASCVLNAASLGIELTRWVVIDALLAILIVTFRQDLVTVPPDKRPVLRLAEFGLADRETQILHLIWGGLTSKEVAAELNISDGTVRTYLSKIYQKLKVAGTKELMLLPHTHEILFAPGEPGEPERMRSRKQEMVKS